MRASGTRLLMKVTKPLAASRVHTSTRTWYSKFPPAEGRPTMKKLQKGKKRTGKMDVCRLNAHSSRLQMPTVVKGMTGTALSYTNTLSHGLWGNLNVLT